jgi:hypothetical protein
VQFSTGRLLQRRIWHLSMPQPMLLANLLTASITGITYRNCSKIRAAFGLGLGSFSKS